MRCEARIWHGPGHQSSTRCRVKGRHELHEAVYGEFQQYAEWRDGQYIAKLRASGLKIPDYVDAGTMMTGFFDEPPRDEEAS